jgi:hypothetical protein
MIVFMSMALSGCAAHRAGGAATYDSSRAVPVPPGLAFTASYPEGFTPAPGPSPDGLASGGGTGLPYRADVAAGKDPATGADIELYVVADDFGWLEREILNGKGPQAYWEQVSETFAGVAGGTSFGARALDAEGLDAGEVYYAVPAGAAGNPGEPRLFMKRYLVKGGELVCATCSVPILAAPGWTDHVQGPESVPAASAVCRPFLDSLKIAD